MPKAKLATAACIAMVPMQRVGAQSLPHQDFIANEWQNFVEFCSPFFQDPLAASKTLLLEGPGITLTRTADGAFFEYLREEQNALRELTYFMAETPEVAEFHCDLARSFRDQRRDADEVAATFESLIAQTGDIELSGGLIEYVVSDGLSVDQLQSAELRSYSYRIEGVFPGELTVLEAGTGYYSFMLTVAARYHKSEGLQ